MNIGFLITVRLKSTRLPRKVLKDLNGMTVLGHVIERAKRVAGIDEIVVCTSTNPQDRPLLDVARDHGVYWFTGSEHDVLDRLRHTSTDYGFDYVLGITGENPLFSISHASLLAAALTRQRCDFITIEGLPFGCAAWGMDTRTMQTACEIKPVSDTEFWGHLVNKPEVFDVQQISARDDYRRPHYIFSLDYPEDYALACHIFEKFREQTLPRLREVIEYIDGHPRLMKPAADRPRLLPAVEQLENIDRFFNENRQTILKTKNRYYS
ncbi:MAG: 3-deoxy-manno-octulosonate cytidylyltransferase [Gammaproteobacteria bacterium]|nr:3-deoxy-manno-octulosonate cytidylyltransferase [Gammaproteobacteria bacterium]